jgi:3,4-dihydroxy 2-butanone 4-phosphate synthase/GTP cyclohydrolase II
VIAGFASAEELIADVQAGRMIVLAGEAKDGADLVLPADCATADAVNFMATHGRGLIRLALTEKRAAELGLTVIPGRGAGSRGEAFTTSIEARTGVTTGISAADRARTIAVSVDPTCSREDIVTPGHVFPILAKEGGVLARSGYTEAAVDLARLAGRPPVGVICQIIDEDGTIPSLDGAIAFARSHGLKIGSIADIATYRRRTEKLVACAGEHRFHSRYGGEWVIKVYHNAIEGIDYLALVKGEIIDVARPTLVRIHTVTMFDDLLGREGPRAHLLQAAMDEIGRDGSGVIIVVSHTRSLSYAAIIAPELEEAETGLGTSVGRERDLSFAWILADLGVRDMILMTRTQWHRSVQLDHYGLNIVGDRPLAAAGPLATA